MPTPPIEVFDVLDSTNAEARRRAEAGEGGPVWIVALEQTAGRGRRGRDWRTNQGALASTLLVRTDRSPLEAAQVSFVAALAVADLADAYLGEGSARLKWPNDLMIHGRKAAGILVESGAWPEGGLWLAVGIGVNLAHAPTGVERPATCLADHMDGPPPQPREAAEVLASRFDHWIDVWNREGFAAVARAWTERAYGLGDSCEVRLPRETIHGTAEGLDDDGALRLRLDSGSILRITAGDVFFGGS